jgi:hypothetical protein
MGFGKWKLQSEHAAWQCMFLKWISNILEGEALIWNRTGTDVGNIENFDEILGFLEWVNLLTRWEIFTSWTGERMGQEKVHGLYCLMKCVGW